jgi:hypothetical protein
MWPILPASTTDPQGERMSSSRRIAGIGAITILILLIAELATWGNPQVSDPIDKITGYFVESRSLALVSVFISMVLAIVYLVFGSAIRVTLSEAREGRQPVLPEIAFGATILMAGAQLSLAMATGSLAVIGAQASEGEMRVLLGLTSWMDMFRVMALGVVIGAIALSALRTGVGPRWVGWVGIAASALLLVSQVSALDPTGPIGNMGNASMVGLLLLLVWLIAFGVSLMRSPAPAEASWRAEQVLG